MGCVFAIGDLEGIGSIGAACVAFFALAVAVHEGRATRKHNRLSVRPLLRIDRSKGGISLYNTGSGPAILQNFEVLVDGEKIAQKRPTIVAVETLQIMQLLPPSEPGDAPLYTYTPEPRDSLMAQERFGLLTIAKPPASQDDHIALMQRLRRVSFRIRYESVYGEKQEFPNA